MTLDLLGKRFGKLTVVEKAGSINVAAAGKKPNRHVAWKCICDCGNYKVVTGTKLKFNNTQSCGCLGGGGLKTADGKYIRYGAPINTKEYNAWTAIKRRCLSPSCKLFKNYGARGISVCERWKNSFPNFLKDMGYAPSPEHSIDRYPNNDGNYEPGNCRWATDAEQAINKRSNVFVVYNGERLTISQWAIRIGCSYSYMWKQAKLGKPIDTIFNEYKKFQCIKRPKPSEEGIKLSTNGMQM